MSAQYDSPHAQLGDRSLFSTLRARAYLNHAAISPACDPVRAAVARVLEESAGEGSAAFSRRLSEREALRQQLGAFLGARDPDGEIALLPNTMFGLSSIALSLPWQRGDRVLAFTGEYPTNVTTWQRAAQLFGLEIVLLPVSDFAKPEGPDFTRLEAELARGRVRLCAASVVQFQTGLQLPIARIAELCHRHGAELAVDAVQALGSIPLDVNALGIDYLAAGSHKWLLGLDGAGVVYVRRDLCRKLRAAIAGAMSHEGALELFFAGPGHLRYDRPLRDDARVLEGGMLSTTSLAALGASLPLLASLGAAAIARHVQAYHDALEPELVALGLHSLRMPDPARRSGILSFRVPERTPALQLTAALAEAGIVCSSPDGVLRFSPHFWCSLAEVPHVVAAVRGALAAAG